MTSNVGFERNNIGFNKNGDSSVISNLKEYFNTAFINRVDNILIFDRLEETAIREIILKRIEDIKIKYSSICIIIDNNVVNELIEKCNFYEFGARRVDKIISKYIENVIIDGIINGSSEVYINSIYNKKNITS